MVEQGQKTIFDDAIGRLDRAIQFSEIDQEAVDSGRLTNVCIAGERIVIVPAVGADTDDVPVIGIFGMSVGAPHEPVGIRDEER